ncbi:MAG: NAD(P)-dependent oxidoreductase [Vulcanimicrobiaceae bacterium]
MPSMLHARHSSRSSQPAPGNSRSDSLMKVGMIGLGEMGASFVERLLSAGQTVIGWNRTKAKAEPLIARGMLWADSPRAVTEAADVVLTTVTDAKALAAVTDGDDGILAAVAGKLFVEMSTIAPDDIRALATRVAERGGTLIDAAVLGSSLTTRQGKLVIMLGGDDAAVAKVTPVLADIGPKVFHLGTIGQAKTMKIALNLNLPAQILALSEGLMLAVKSGIDRDKALDIMLNGVIASPMLQYRAPFIRAMPAKAWFDVDMMQKDMDLALSLGKELGVPLMATAVSREALSAARGQGLSKYDFAVLYFALAHCAGVNAMPTVEETASVNAHR